MALMRVNTRPTPRQLREFGFVWLGFVSAFAVLAWWRFDNPRAAAWLAGAAVVIPVIGWLQPAFMRLVYVGMSYAAFPIGFVVSHVVMAVVYYLVVTPIGFVMRAVGYDPMRRGFDRSAASYWDERDPATESRRYFRQF